MAIPSVTKAREQAQQVSEQVQQNWFWPRKLNFIVLKNFAYETKELAIKQHVRKPKDDNKGNQSKLYKITDSILHRTKETPYQRLIQWNTFGDFFQSKILKIRDSIDSNSNSLYMDSPPEHEPLFNCFEPVLLEDIEKFISIAPNKTSVLAPVRVDIIKECSEELPVYPAYCQFIAAEYDNAQIPERSRCDTIAKEIKSRAHPKKLQTSVNTAIGITNNRRCCYQSI